MTNQINNQSIIPSTDVIQLTLTVKMTTTAQVVETSVTVNNNIPIQDYVHPDDQTQPTFEMTPGFKPFTIKLNFLTNHNKTSKNSTYLQLLQYKFYTVHHYNIRGLKIHL